MQRLPSPKLAWFSLSLFYMYQYILRVFPSIAEQELRNDLLLSAVDFSTLGAMYLYAYGGIQVPLGVIVDRLGLKKVALTAIILCILGAFLFYASSSLWHLQIGRLLMGIGSAPVFMCALKICSDYIPDGKRGIYMGATLAMGTLGALTSGNLVVILLDDHGWRYTILILGLLGILIIGLILFNIPKQINHSHKEFLNLETLKKVFKNKTVYAYGILGLGFFASLTAFTDLWGTAYLAKRYGIERSEAAAASMMMYIGLSIGSILLPWYFEKKNRLLVGFKLCMFVLTALFLAFILLPNLSFAGIKIIMFFMGMLSGSIMMVFTGAALHTTQETSGMTISIINTFNMFGGGILNQIIGISLYCFWDGTLNSSSVPQYSIQMFNKSFLFTFGSLFFICCMIALSLSSKMSKKQRKN
ncbi:MAG: MFS transporter [Candidatus Paracaedibacteraceae bacterium]|nr:MFS transporter [Candidatus Paracaedibacteraceae bacterium]